RLINVIGVIEDPYGAGADDGTPMAPGLFVTAEIEGRTINDILWAPRASLRGTSQLYVGDVERGVLAIREVSVVHSDEGGVYFRDGAVAGELAVVSPIQSAADGKRLRIRQRQPDGTIGPYVEPTITDEDAASDADAQANLTAGQSEGVAQ
ncbi:MAG: efflux RND transporter periplasmic adaptor subunit, partial [Pseudomonadota bacterium]